MLNENVMRRVPLDRGSYMRSCIIEFMKQVDENDKIWGCVKHLILFPQQV